MKLKLRSAANKILRDRIRSKNNKRRLECSAYLIYVKNRKRESDDYISCMGSNRIIKIARNKYPGGKRSTYSN